MSLRTLIISDSIRAGVIKPHRLDNLARIPLGRLGEVDEIDLAHRRVGWSDPEGGRDSLAYDRLVLAVGSVNKLLPIPGVAEHSFNIDTWDSAVGFDRHLRTVLTSPGAPGRDTTAGFGSCTRPK